MAHMVETMFSVREKPWHYELTKDVTKLIQEAPTSLDALRYAGLDWEVESRHKEFQQRNSLFETRKGKRTALD